MGLSDNGNFVKLMFFLFSAFFGFLIIYELIEGKDKELIIQLVTALLVFFAFVGRSITDSYRNKSGLDA